MKKYVSFIFLIFILLVTTSCVYRRSSSKNMQSDWNEIRYFDNRIVSLSYALDQSTAEDEFYAYPTTNVGVVIALPSVIGTINYTHGDSHYMSNDSTIIKDLIGITRLEYRLLDRGNAYILKLLKEDDCIEINLYLKDTGKNFNFVFLSTGEVVIIDKRTFVSIISYNREDILKLEDKIKEEYEKHKDDKLLDLEKINVIDNNITDIDGFTSLDMEDYSSSAIDYHLNFRIDLTLKDNLIINTFDGKKYVALSYMDSVEEKDYFNLIKENIIKSDFKNISFENNKLSFDIGELNNDNILYLSRLKMLKDYIKNISIKDNHSFEIVGTLDDFFYVRGKLRDAYKVYTDKESIIEDIIMGDISVNSIYKNKIVEYVKSLDDDFFKDKFLYVYGDNNIDSENVYLSLSQDDTNIHFKKVYSEVGLNDKTANFVNFVVLDIVDGMSPYLYKYNGLSLFDVHLTVHIEEDVYEIDVPYKTVIDYSYLKNKLSISDDYSFMLLDTDNTFKHRFSSIEATSDSDIYLLIKYKNILNYDTVYLINLSDDNKLIKIQIDPNQSIGKNELSAITGLNINNIYSTYGRSVASSIDKSGKCYYFDVSFGSKFKETAINKECACEKITNYKRNEVIFKNYNLYFKIARYYTNDSANAKYSVKYMYEIEDYKYFVLERKYDNYYYNGDSLKICYDYVTFEDIFTYVRIGDTTNFAFIVDDVLIDNDCIYNSSDSIKYKEIDENFKINYSYDNGLIYKDITSYSEKIDKIKLIDSSINYYDDFSTYGLVDKNASDTSFLKSVLGISINLNNYNIYFTKRYDYISVNTTYGYYLKEYSDSFEIIGRRINRNEIEYDNKLGLFYELILVDININKQLKSFTYADNNNYVSTITYMQNGSVYNVNDLSSRFPYTIAEDFRVIRNGDDYKKYYYLFSDKVYKNDFLITDTGIRLLIQRNLSSEKSVNITYSLNRYDKDSNTLYLYKHYNGSDNINNGTCLDLVYIFDTSISVKDSLNLVIEEK